MTPPQLTLRSVRATAIKVPLNFVLGTSAQAVREAPLLLVDIETEEGITGHAYQFCYTPKAAGAIAIFLDDALSAVKGLRVDPEEIWRVLAKRYILIGVQGIVRMAMSMMDVACWDAVSKAAGVPLATYLGAAPRPIPAYNSCGLGLMAPQALADEAEKLLNNGGFRAVKLRLGYATLEEDLAATRAVRNRVADSVMIMTDFNQALSAEEALRRGRALDDEGIYWIEEPVRHDDYLAAATLAAEIATPVQLGENFSQVYDMEKALSVNACDFVMPDLERIGGVTGWLRAARVAHEAGIEMSSHLYPEVSAHLLAATPTAHWLEYVDWANAFLVEPLQIKDGYALPGTQPGNGLAWDAALLKRYLV